MKVAKLIGLNGEGLPELEGTIRMAADGQLIADTPAAEHFLNEPIAYGERRLTKIDGELFLEMLPKAINGSYARFVLEEEAEVPQQHAREPEDAFAVPSPKRRGYSSIPRILLDIAEQGRRQSQQSPQP